MKTKFCLTFIFLCVIFSTKAQSSLELAQQFEGKKHYLEASVLYERIIFEPANNEQLYTAIFAKIECLKKQASYIDCIEFIKKNIVQLPTDSLKSNIYYQWILCSYLSNQLDETISLIEQSKVYFPSYYNSQLLNFLKILTLNEQAKWAEAKLVYKQWLLSKNIDTVFANIYDSVPKLKSENKGGWLATFIPGGGLVYAGKYGEALTSILLQGAGLYYGIASFNSKYYLSAWLIGAGTAGSFHFGSIRRTETLIKQYNKRKSAYFNDKIKLQLISQL